MNTSSTNETNWAAIGSALERLFTYERGLDDSSHVSPDLLSSIASSATDSFWRRYLIAGNNLSIVVDQITENRSHSREVLAAARERIDLASTRLAAHLGDTGKDPSVLDLLYRDFPKLLYSRRMDDVADILIEVHRINETVEGDIKRNGFDFSVEQIEAFLRSFSCDETIGRLDTVAAWLQRVNRQNHDGLTLTPVLVDYLAEPGDIDLKLTKLNRLREETRHGLFDLSSPVHRDTEFHRFASVYNSDALAPLRLKDLYPVFIGFKELPPQEEEDFILDGQHAVEARRAAYEAFCFLRFLQKFRGRTARPIVVIGNDRYGRQWVVEPIEDYLKEGFTTRSFRTPSHKSTRLTVPHMIGNTGVRSGFTRDFVIEINHQMPHLVLVDARNPADVGGAMRLSRATRDYANWFALFNHLRAEGDGSRYERYMPLPAHHFAELRKWHCYEEVKRQLKPWVTPGTTYKVALWAPELTQTGVLGDFVVPRPNIEIGGDEPLVVLANPLFNVTDEDDPDLHESLRGNRSYYFDGPERYETHERVFGFGPHGLETRIVGTTTDVFVEAVQQEMKKELARLLREDEN